MRVLAAFILFFLFVSGPSSPQGKESSIPEQVAYNQDLTVAVISDPHYFSSELLIEKGKAFNDYLKHDRKLLVESSTIADHAINEIIKEKPNYMLVCGDLTKDGEEVCHRDFIERLKLIENSGIQVFVCPGNHDINNPHAVSYLGNKASRVKNISSEEFRSMYHNFGYDRAFSEDTASLSYAAMLSDSICLVSLDVCRYEENDKDPVVGGRLRDRTRQWMHNLLVDARQKQIRVLVMMHHGLLEHFKSEKKFFPDYLIDKNDEIAEEWAGLGVKLVFTGHFHAQDMVNRDFESGGKLVDVETGSLVTYPLAYRMVSVNQSFDVNIRSSKVDFIYDGQEMQQYARTFISRKLESLSAEIIHARGNYSRFEVSLVTPAISEIALNHYEGKEENISLYSRVVAYFVSRVVQNDPTFADVPVDAIDTDLAPNDSQYSFQY